MRPKADITGYNRSTDQHPGRDARTSARTLDVNLNDRNFSDTPALIMSSTYFSLYDHLVFSTKDRRPTL